MPTPTDDERVVEKAVDLFWRVYDDEWSWQSLEDCVRQAIVYGIELARKESR